MSDKVNITYLFDPLCGWCYGASALLGQIAAMANITLELAPTGLFSDAGARPMDDSFAAYAWSNDIRIASLTGKRFTETYRNKVLGKGGMLDSGPATLAITAVLLTAPSRELEAVGIIQEARYVSGRDITGTAEIRTILEASGLGTASDRLGAMDPELIAGNSQRVRAAKALMQEFRVDGVPALIVDDGLRRQLVRANELFGNSDLLAKFAREQPPRIAEHHHL